MKSKTFASITALMSVLCISSATAATLTYNFDNGPGDDGLDRQGWTDVQGETFTASAVFNSAGNFGGRGTGGAANGTGNQDSQHPNLIFRSPAFSTTSTTTIDFQFGFPRSTTSNSTC